MGEMEDGEADHITTDVQGQKVGTQLNEQIKLEWLDMPDAYALL